MGVGRRPKPSALKRLQGNPGGRPLNADEPVIPEGRPEKPKGMGKVASREWDRTEADLSAAGLLSRVDGKALANYCKAEGLGERYFKDALEEPYVFDAQFDKDGNIVGHKKKLSPATLGWVACTKVSKAYLIEFGLTPAARAKLHVEKPVKSADEFPTREATVDIPKEEADLLGSIDETKVSVN